MPVLSIILPVFNAEPFLSNCLESVLNQSLTNFECICIDNGSTDKSADIIKSYLLRDERLKYHYNGQRGVSIARNTGLGLAKGNYVFFLDADDWMEGNMLEQLVNGIELKNADWVICNAWNENGMPSKRLALGGLDNKLFETGISEFKEFINFRFDFALWNKLYKLSLIRASNINFEKELFIGEDMLFNFKYFHAAKNFLVLEQPLYHYRIYPDSTMAVTKKDYPFQFNKILKIYRDFTRSKPELWPFWEVFREEWSRSFYNSVLPQLSATNSSTLSLSNTLSLMDEDLMKYQSKGVFGINYIKKWLLENHYFKAFEIIMKLKNRMLRA